MEPPSDQTPLDESPPVTPPVTLHNPRASRLAQVALNPGRLAQGLHDVVGAAVLGGGKSSIRFEGARYNLSGVDSFLS
jgi:hypothetical protein